MSSELLRAVQAEIDRCAVGRDNPTHRRLLAGELTRAELQVWARQQWLWHRAFPGVLALLAAQCPSPVLRGGLLRRAAEEDGALPDASPGRSAEWEQVSAALGVSGGDLREAMPTPETEAMIAVQRSVAARPFSEAWIGIMVGVDGETQTHNGARRQALREHYGVPEAALAYVRVPAQDPVRAALAPVRACAEAPFTGALEALRLVLRARWNYFDGITADAGARCRSTLSCGP